MVIQIGYRLRDEVVGGSVSFIYTISSTSH